LNKKINNLENLKKEFNHLKQNLENSQAEKANLTSQIQLLEQKFESYKADTEGKIDSLMKAKDKLELEIRLKEDQNHLKELRIKELQIQLEDQLKIQDEFVEIRSKLKALSSKVEDVETQKRLDWLLRAIDTFLNRKIKFF
jgi:predicted nuclease with TOPRIM domain